MGFVPGSGQASDLLRRSRGPAPDAVDLAVQAGETLAAVGGGPVKAGDKLETTRLNDANQANPKGSRGASEVRTGLLKNKAQVIGTIDTSIPVPVPPELSIAEVPRLFTAALGLASRPRCSRSAMWSSAQIASQTPSRWNLRKML